MRIYISEKVGNVFWLDDEGNLCSKPLNKDDTLVDTSEPEFVEDGYTETCLNTEEEKYKKEIKEALT